MVSELVLWPVSMMIGALKPFLRRMRTASRPSMSGRPTSMITRSIWPALAACTPLVPLSTATDFELLVQRELLDQRVAQLAHRRPRSGSCGHSTFEPSRKQAPAIRTVGEVEHSGVKEQAGFATRTRFASIPDASALFYAAAGVFGDSRAHPPREPDPRRAAGGAARDSGRARPRRHPRQQARRRRRNPARAVSAGPPVVAGRPLAAATQPAAASAHYPEPGVVRRYHRPPLQPAVHALGQ